MMKLVGIFVLAIAVVAHGSTTNTPPATEEHTTVPVTEAPTPKHTDTTVTDPTTKATTTEPKPVTTKSTAAPEPTTTTEAQTTESPATNTTESSTTPAATTGGDVTTTSEVPTMAPTATPDIPDAPKNAWTVNSTDTVCIMMEMGALMSVNYTDKDNKTATAAFILPPNATVTGSCNDTDGGQYIEFAFHSNWTLRFTFKKHKQDKDAYFEANEIKLVFDYDPTVFTGISDEQKYEKQMIENKNLTIYHAYVGKSYVCNSDSDVTLDDMAKMTTKDLQVQAFRDDNKVIYGDSQQCPADSTTSNIVPIAVGAALAALVVIVLIAYLISRNKNKGGYESV